MITILTIIHILVCIFLICIVLLQHGKGADIGATFGGASQTLFGTEGPLPLMNKVTTGAAVIFMVTSIALAYTSSHRGTGSIMSDFKPAAPTPIEQAIPAPTGEAVPLSPMMQRTEQTTPAEAPISYPGQDMPQTAPASEAPQPAAAPMPAEVGK